MEKTFSDTVGKCLNAIATREDLKFFGQDDEVASMYNDYISDKTPENKERVIRYIKSNKLPYYKKFKTPI